MTDDERPVHRCIAGQGCRRAEVTEGGRQAALTDGPDTLCDACRGAVEYAITDMPEIWMLLHGAIGDQSRRAGGQKVKRSRSAPINLNTDVDALKAAIVEWMVAAAAPISEVLNTDDPHPHNNTDAEQFRVVLACTRLLSTHVDDLLATPTDNVSVWLSASETAYPGERYYVDDHGVTHSGTGIQSMDGVDLALKLVQLRSSARSLLALTTPHDKLSVPCPHCNTYELVRTHRTIRTVGGKNREIDQINCGNCGLDWPYERYRQLCLIWVKEDEMEREKLQKQLDHEKARREMAEWLLAKREWQLSLAAECTNITAADFAATVLEVDDTPSDLLMSDNELAAYLSVADSTIRSWATRGHITRHTADDGSTLYNAAEVIAHHNSDRKATRCSA
jgi:hypothetical protein